MKGLGLPGLSSGISSLSSLPKKEVIEDIEKVGRDVNKSGKKIVNYIFGKGMKNSATPSLSFGAKEKLFPGDEFGLAGKSNFSADLDLSLGATSLFGGKDIKKKIDNSFKNLGSGVVKTGEKVENYLFGGGTKTSIQPAIGVIDLNEKLPKITSLSHPWKGLTSSSGATDIKKNVQDNLGKLKSDVEKTSEHDVNRIAPGKSKIAIQPGGELDGRLGATGSNEKLPDISGNIEFSQKPNISGHSFRYPLGNVTSSPSATYVSKNIHDDLGQLRGGVQTNAVDSQYGKPSNYSGNSLPSFLGVTIPNSGSGFVAEVEGKKAINVTSKKTTADISQSKGNRGVDVDDSSQRNHSPAPLPLPSVISNDGNKVKNTTDSERSSLIGNTTLSILHEEDRSELSNSTVGELPGFPSITNTQNNTSRNLEVNANSPSNKLEETTNGPLGISKMPTKPTTKSEKTSRKIEDIQQGSGNITTISPERIDQNLNKKGAEVVSSNPANSQDFIYTHRVTNEDLSTVEQRAPFDTTILEVSEEPTTPLSVLNPFYIVPSGNNTIGEQFTPELPPTVFDKPTNGKAPFIPILPPLMESTIKNIVKPSPTKASHTMAPPTIAVPSRSLTPVEYGAIGVGGILIFAFIAYIYQKYKQYRARSSGGSYSPKANQRNAAGRKRSTRSNDSGEGQSQDVNKANKTTKTRANINGDHAEVTVVEIASEVKSTQEVIEIPIKKTVVNGLQNSSTNDNQVSVLTSGRASDCIEIISEKQKPAKQPRKTKTPTNTPEKFTSDKTSASQLNGGSLKTVSHAIGGILISHVPDKQETEKQTPSQQPDPEESKGDSSDEGVSLLGKLTEASTLKAASENTLEVVDPDNVTFEEPNASVEGVPVKEETNGKGLLYTSFEKEVDAGSEYFSADENSDSKISPPLSPSLKKQIEKFKEINLRAEDVYNTEIIKEDGRRTSLEEDIAESIYNKRDDTKQVTPTKISENCKTEFLQLSALVSFASSEDIPITKNDIEPDCSKREINQSDLPKKNYIQNSMNAERSNIQQYRKEEAEAIQDDILRASHLDSLTMQSIRQDLGNSIEIKPRSRWSDNMQSCSDTVIHSIHETQNCTTRAESYDFTSRGRNNEINTDEDKLPNQNDTSHYLINAIDTAELGESNFPTKNESQTPKNLMMMNNIEHYDSKNTKTQDIANSSNESSIVHVEETNRILTSNFENLKSDTGPLTNATSNFGSNDVPGNVSAINDVPGINDLIDHFDSRSEKQIDITRNNDTIDGGLLVEHNMLEFIPPKQPQILEDVLIVFSNSTQESISTLSNSTLDSNCQYEERLGRNNKQEEKLQDIPATNSNCAICEECGGIQAEELVADKSNGLEHINIAENEVEQGHSKWYVPNDEISDSINEEDKSVGDLYIVLTPETSEPTPCIYSLHSENFPLSDPYTERSSSISNDENINSSSSYIDVKYDPTNEGWPAHLPRNIHSISGVGLIKTANVASSTYDVLKEEECEILPSTPSGTKGGTNIEELERINSVAGNPSKSSNDTHQKPIPKFILPNMNARLSKKRSSRRRQIKSLDSGVHHYYGEYLNLVEFPEIETDDRAEKTEKVIEDIITIKPDGTITEEKIIIPNTH